MTGSKELKISIDVMNLEEYKNLLQKATDQMEQLEKIFKEIEKYELVIKKFKILVS